MSKIVGDEACPSCREQGGDKTGNHLILFENGGKHCNRCGYTVPPEGEEMSEQPKGKFTVEDVSEFSVAAINDRAINKVVADVYGVRTGVDENRQPSSVYFPVYSDGSMTGYKERKLDEKKFYAVGSIKNADLFGKHLYSGGGKMVVITEGEYDCLAAYQMFMEQGKKYRVVSLPDGANAAAVKRNFEWLDSFQSIIIAFDQDDPGKKAAQEVAELFSPGKVKIMSFDEKDANDMLMAGKHKEFMQSLYNANTHRPDGIVSGSETWERLKNRPEVHSVPYPDDWEEMNKKTYGVRIGELDTWTSGSGMGKTAALRELQFHLLNTTDSNIGIIALEEPLEDSVEALMSLHLNKRISLPDVREKTSEEEMYEAWKATAGTNRLHFYDHFGSVDDDNLVSKIRFLAKGLGCKYIFLDHLSIVVSEFADQGGERERIDTIMTRLKNLTQELGIWLGLVVHLRKVGGGGKSFEEGAVPTLDDLRGSGSIKQLSNNVYALSRNQQHEDDTIRNTSHFHVLKCRFTGRTGAADYVYFDDSTGRLVATDNPSEVEEEEEF